MIPHWLVIAVTVLLVALAGSSGQLLEFLIGHRVFFNAENPQFTAFEELQDVYTRNYNLLMVLAPASGDIFTPRVIERSWMSPNGPSRSLTRCVPIP